ncbi:MAG: ribosome maturation factor RimP [Candidatus Thiodiazotropha sp. (ex Lucinoma aequizonata)]|nr:ribosome maturation factor RimP [Candidatus Thiodiazotropha sp. (ex Lucinoma aequizonata)]MCU7887792.1 ribosome maturation factor RimP [Candidatus Thiodiazotropha sp. (ex Lucinoma aequizonata)]MCU7893947.1 ribosome maturation factor RimP [Candidatus Thiodiazotropha sp. (ex Lucinoma aequizonata)]MCU7899323.1 ribosome maturation factor RimP [Candidatus Thiodiazotropha sp. (ex Lucinoma aequizonata)]MCU7903853.1 ribosome maturation factor RimP [Candidatus Thiodiazotropha sp. (ex Lucinoma aequizo
MRSAPEKLKSLVRKEVELLGYELVGVEMTGRGKGGSLLRIYIDHEDGIVLDDCVQVSHQVSGVLDVEDPIKEQYQLEVSSPGMDRPLFEQAHFKRFQGSKVRVKTHTKIENRQRFKGVLSGIEENQVLIEKDGTLYRIPIELIDSARVIPEF